MPYQANLIEEHLKEARKCKASLDYHRLAYISKGTQPAMNAEQSNTTQAVNDSKSNKNYPTDNPVAETVQNGATAGGQETENVSETYQANFLEEHLKEARECKANLDYHRLAYISRGTQPARDGESFGIIFSKANARGKDEEIQR